MELYFESFSDKHVAGFDTRETPQKSIIYTASAFCQAHYVRVLAHKDDLAGKENPDGYEEGNMEEVAVMLVKFAIPFTAGYGANLWAVADDEDETWGRTFEKLIKSAEYKKCLPIARRSEYLNVYVDHLYVHPQYRKRGIGQYLLNNLDSILEFVLNRGIHSISAFLEPTPIDETDTVPMGDAEMLALMKKCYTAAGFKQVGRSRVFIQNYTKKRAPIKKSAPRDKA